MLSKEGVKVWHKNLVDHQEEEEEGHLQVKEAHLQVKDHQVKDHHQVKDLQVKAHHQAWEALLQAKAAHHQVREDHHQAIMVHLQPTETLTLLASDDYFVF